MAGTEHFERLLALAAREIPGPEATASMWRDRQEAIERYGTAIAYEIISPEDPSEWEVFVHQELAKLADHLRAKHMLPPGEKRFLVYVWRAAKAYRFDGPSFWHAIATIQGCTVEALVGEVERWRRDREGGATSKATRALLPQNAPHRNKNRS